MRRNRLKRMRKLADLARSEERRVCEEMGRAQRQLNEHEERLDELEAYRRDYSDKFRPGGHLSPARWQDYQHFLQRIDDAVVEQRSQIEAGKAARDAHRRRWLIRRQKLESIERVVERFRKDEDERAERRQQRTLDEIAMARGPGRRGAGNA